MVVVLAVACVSVAGLSRGRAGADATGPPPLPANCPSAQYPRTPPHLRGDGYDPAPTGPSVPYEVKFEGTLDGGTISVPSPDSRSIAAVIPNLYASVCGVVDLLALSGTVAPDDVALATPNVYVGYRPLALPGPLDALEALPLKVSFGHLSASLDRQAAHNGGLDISLVASASASVNTLGLSCRLAINDLAATTNRSGHLTGQPVTGPVSAGVATVVANDFAVPAMAPSPTCPPLITNAFNRALHLPLPPGVASFVAPLRFRFELNDSR